VIASTGDAPGSNSSEPIPRPVSSGYGRNAAMAAHADVRAIPDMWFPFGHHECCYQRLGKFLVHSIRHISADQTTIHGAVNQKWEIASRRLDATDSLERGQPTCGTTRLASSMSSVRS